MKTIEKKEPYLHILNTRGNIYEEFLPDQVLTHKNLNKIVNYFEDQDRLSRIYLTGVGVGCGLNIVSSSTKHIEIGQGVGITTDGDIIKSETRRFQYYSALTDKAEYDLFTKGDMKVYELYEKGSAGRENELPLASFSTNESTTLKDCIVIAYVESYTEDEGLCGGSGCDETGNKVFSNLKFLITHKNNKDILTSDDTIYQSHDVLDYYDKLPDLCLPRIILTPTNTNVGMPIIKQYKDTFILKGDLYVGISTIIRNFSQRINFQKYGVLISDIAIYIDTIFSELDDEYVQYRYDLLKDLIDTYNEIRSYILHSKFECVPNIKAFPKHLLLGTPEPTTRLETRHDFYPSPMVSENDENLIAIRTLCIKFFYQLKDFNILNFESAQIKITPSKTYDFKLSERSIPYYYKSGSSLVNNWNPEANKNRRSSYQLGYTTTNLKDLACIKDPLNYNHLDKDFYRIEGHQGKNFVLALRNILKKKAQYNLPFDVKAISVGYPVNKISLDEDTCETKEYVTLIKTWEEEFNCTANRAIDFFRRYQYTVLGTNDTVSSVHTVLKAAQAENDKEEAVNVKTPIGIVESLQDNLAVAVTETKNVKTSFKTAANQKYATAKDRIVLGGDVAANYTTRTNSGYKYSLAFIIENVVDGINPENLTADYVVSQVVAVLDRRSNNQTIDTDSNEFKLYFEIPMRLITHLEIVKYRFIKQLQDVYVTERWTAFHSAFADLCTEVEKVLNTLSTTTENGTFGKLVHDKMYEFLVHKIAGLCCIKEKFNWLKTQLDDIRLNLYKELILSKFIEQHPGLEHMAGVPKGGTFLLVYLGERQVKLEDEDTIVEKFDRKVLFDFALPYMCMSECAPKTIVYSDLVDPVTLAIARKKFCLPSDSDQVDFIVEPERGVVTSPDGEAFIITTAQGYAFDPTQVPDELLGEGIRFLVDGKIPTIPIETMVYKLPEDVTASYEFVAWTEDGLVINLNVTHELEDLLYLQHTWKRNNGSEIALGKNPSNILILTEATLFQEDITILIDVIGNPVPCSLEIPITIDEEQEIIEVGVNMTEEICYNVQETTPISETITVTPSDGVLTSPQEPANGQSFIEFFDGVYTLNPLFVPAALAGEPITFEVNGIPVEDFATRVYFIPGTMTTGSEVISWDDTGVNIKLGATHAYDDKAYFAYEWVNENGEVIANTRIVNTRFDSLDGDVNRSLCVRAQVIGSEDELCISEEFTLEIAEVRPDITVSIPPAICWLEDEELEPINIVVSDDQAVLKCPIAEEIGIELLQGDSGNYAFNSIAVPNELIGVPIEFQIEDELVASTVVYKVPSSINANYDNPSWNGNTLSIDLKATHSLEDQIDTIEEYLQYIWKDAQGAIILTEKEQINFEIITNNGSINENYTLDVQVKEELIENSCEHTNIEMVIEENRPDVTVTIVPEICHVESQSGVLRYEITVTPSSFSVSSPDGVDFIQGSLGNYMLNPALVPEQLLGEDIRFVADGEVKATTKVYKIPELVQTNISIANESWETGGLAVDLTSNITNRSYYKYEWFMRKDNVDTLLDKVSEPNRYLIPDNQNGVNVQVFLRLSANTNGILCSQETIKTTVRRSRPVTVSKSRFCLPDAPVIFRGVSEDTGVLKSTNSSLPSNVITINSGRYQFNPDRVPQTLWGTTLRFSVDNITQSGLSIIVYKTPIKETIVQDIPASKWIQGGYEFVFTHDLIDKNYFSYQVILKSNQTVLQKVREHTYLVPTNDDLINDQIVVMISSPVGGCVEENTIPVATTRPDDQPLARLECSTPYADRLQILGADRALNSLKLNFKGQPFEDVLKNEILDPLDQVIIAILSARIVSTLVVPATAEINRLRGLLMSKYYNNTNINPAFNQLFLELDEIMEVIVLELLRCVTNVDDNLNNEINTFFTDSNARNAVYVEKPRTIITNTYVTGFVPKASVLKPKFDTVFAVTKTKRK
ncbi:hypothetical protein [Kordia jejudonensis]|uniref:hypothetical protein n=1 Tax=Kordia jejudonensis TaxID=1348245 RepID=UPI0006291641|nr:hypothetical protein [Kordia jejudonensis]